MSSNCCSVGFELSNNFYAGPLEAFRKTQGVFYDESPYMARAVFIPLSFLDGVTKPFFFPLYVLVGLVAFPIIALAQYCKKEIDDDIDFFTKKPSDYMKAWGFSVLATGGILTILILTSTYVPLIGTGAILATAFTVSLSVHIYRACRTPETKKDFVFIKVSENP